MNKKNIIAGTLTAILLFVIFSTPAAAGSRQRGRWEGFAIGLGAAVLGHTLIHHHHATGHYRAPVDRHPPRRFHHNRHGHRKPHVDRHPPRHRYHHRHRHGHWQWQRVWVPPAFKKTWKPGHHGRRGRGNPGRWVKVPVRRGYWKKERVWAAGRR